jgi:hypothetical protein
MWSLIVDPRPLLLIPLAFALRCFWIYRTPTVAMVGLDYYDDFCFGLFLFLLLVAARFIQIVATRSLARRAEFIARPRRSRHWFWPCLFVVGFGTRFMIQSEIPMKVAFRVSRPALDRMADAALIDPENANLLADRWAGLYQIRAVEVIGNTVVLYLDGFSGQYGFARVPGYMGDYIYNDGDANNPHHCKDFPRSDHPGGPHGPSGVKIGSNWFVLYNFYWLVKIGWS